MTPRINLRFGILAFVLTCAISMNAGDVVESIVATVNGHPIFSSELDEALQYQCLAEQKPLDLTSAARQAALQRLIDQSFIEQQLRLANPMPIAPEQVENSLQELRRQVTATDQQSSDAAWKRSLQNCGLTEGEVREKLRRQLEILRFVNSRFRSGVHVSQSEVEAYYRDTLSPQSRADGTSPPAVSSVTVQITEVLVQQKINQALAAWLKGLREQSSIEVQ